MRLALPTCETVYGKDKTHPDPYLTRWSWGPFFVHIFHRGDNDPDYHDHKRPFWTLPLTSYVEDALNFPSWRTAAMLKALGNGDPQPKPTPAVVRAFRVHRREATHAHRIEGRWTGRWCYLTNRFGGRGRRWYEEPEYREGRIITLGMWDMRPPVREWGFWKGKPHCRVLSDGTVRMLPRRFRWVPWREYVFGPQGQQTAD